jgi:hypothetical protein
MSKRLKRGMIAVGAVAVLAGGGAAIAGATGAGDDDGSERAITGSALDRASAVALKHVGGGRVTGTEAGDQEGAYEVEVTRADGSQVDVYLDRSFAVISGESDSGESDRGEGD